MWLSGTLQGMKPPAAPAGGPSDAVVLTRVEPEDWQRLRDVRLAALAESPEMFGSTLAKEQSFDETEWRRRAERPATFLASRHGVDVGMAGDVEVIARQDDGIELGRLLRDPVELREPVVQIG